MSFPDEFSFYINSSLYTRGNYPDLNNTGAPSDNTSINQASTAEACINLDAMDEIDALTYEIFSKIIPQADDSPSIIQLEALARDVQSAFIIPNPLRTTPSTYSNLQPFSRVVINSNDGADQSQPENSDRDLTQKEVSQTETNSNDAPPIKKKKRGRRELDKSAFQCFICLDQKPPEWRKGPWGLNTFCNACGIQYSKYVKLLNEKTIKCIPFEFYKKPSWAKSITGRMLKHTPEYYGLAIKHLPKDEKKSFIDLTGGKLNLDYILNHPEGNDVTESSQTVEFRPRRKKMKI
jgi:GATA zinc finger